MIRSSERVKTLFDGHLRGRSHPHRRCLNPSCQYYSTINGKGTVTAAMSLLIGWRGHQTSTTVVSLKGRLPQKLQSKSTLSCEIVQIHSLFLHGFIKKPKSRFNRNRK